MKKYLKIEKPENISSFSQITLAGVVLEHCLISDVVAQLETEIKIAERVQAVSEFNKVGLQFLLICYKCHVLCPQSDLSL